MTPGSQRAGVGPIGERLRQRVESLGLTLLRISPDGNAQALGPLPWVEALVIRSQIFGRNVRERWGALASAAGQPVEVGDAMWLVPIQSRRRRPGQQHAADPVTAVLLLGAELAVSEHLLDICSEFRLDAQAALLRVDPSRLVSSAEATRLAAMLNWLHEDTQEVARRGHDTQQLSRELAESYEELTLLYKLSAGMTVDQPPAAFLDLACLELQQVSKLAWMSLCLTDEDLRLGELSGAAFLAGSASEHPEVLREVGGLLLRRFAGEHEPVVIDDAATLGLPELTRLTRDLLVVPLRVEGVPLAILFGGSGSGEEDDNGQITSADAKLCASLGHSLTIFLQNRMLYEDVQSTFLGALHALTSAIDAKDSYTHGHSERVAMLSRMLAQASGLDAHAAERVYLSGLIHDVGKIGVPERVLGKPGRLTEEEFRLIKLHPTIGARILQDIRQMSDLIPGVLHHHEQWCGRGYPHGLAGDAIPLFGRVIALADAFDAMSSDRTYRSAMPLDVVLDEVRRCAGVQFDPELAARFVELDFEPYFRLIQKHRQREESRAA